MTTFTSEDREAIERGLEFFEQLKQASPPHIVDSGASVMPKNLMTDEVAKELLQQIHVTKYDSLRDYGLLVIRLTEKYYGIGVNHEVS